MRHGVRPTVERALLVALLCGLAGCGPEPGVGAASESAAEPVAAVLPAASGWRALGDWSGQGSRQTGSFDIASGGLRLVWEARGGDAADVGRLRISLHSAISGRPLQTLVDRRGPGADTVLVAANPRVAFLMVDAEQLDWHIRLEERIDRRP